MIKQRFIVVVGLPITLSFDEGGAGVRRGEAGAVHFRRWEQQGENERGALCQGGANVTHLRPEDVSPPNLSTSVRGFESPFFKSSRRKRLARLGSVPVRHGFTFAGKTTMNMPKATRITLWREERSPPALKGSVAGRSATWKFSPPFGTFRE